MKYFPRDASIPPLRMSALCKELPSSPQLPGSHFILDKWSAQLDSRVTWPLLHSTGPGISLPVGSAQRSSAAQQLHLDLILLLHPLLLPHLLPSPHERCIWPQQLILLPPAPQGHSPCLVTESCKTGFGLYNWCERESPGSSNEPGRLYGGNTYTTLAFSLAFISGYSPQIRAALDEVKLTVLPSHSNPWWLHIGGGFVEWYTRAFEQIHAAQINRGSHPRWLTCPPVD